MKIFLSWSGELSQHVATTLSNWLPDVVQDTHTWISDYIGAGTRWTEKLNEELETSDFGVRKPCIKPVVRRGGFL